MLNWQTGVEQTYKQLGMQKQSDMGQIINVSGASLYEPIHTTSNGWFMILEIRRQSSVVGGCTERKQIHVGGTVFITSIYIYIYNLCG